MDGRSLALPGWCIAWPALAALALAGCAGTGPVLEAPQVSLRGVELQEFNFREQTVLLHFDVHNPNAIPLPVKKVRYKVFIERREFAGGETAAGFSVPARGDGQFSISVSLDLVNSAAGLAPLLRAGSRKPLAYELHGSLAVGIPLVRPLRFSREGSIVVH